MKTPPAGVAPMLIRQLDGPDAFAI
jgi:hypothetical protein